MRKLILAVALVALAGCSGGSATTGTSTTSNGPGGTGTGSAATTEGSSGTAEGSSGTTSPGTSGISASSSTSGPTSSSSSSSTTTGTSSSSSSSTTTTGTSSSSSTTTTGTSSSSSSTTGTTGQSSGGGLFFSEYVEGTSNNKALEITNSSNAQVDLSQYAIREINYSATGTQPSGTNDYALSGTLAAGASIVVCNANATFLNLCDIVASGTGSSALGFNGNDTLELIRTAGGIVDSFGDGTNPGSNGWVSGSVGTVDATLRRKCSINQGDTTLPASFNPALEWDAFPTNATCDLGSWCGATATCSQTTTGSTGTTSSTGSTGTTSSTGSTGTSSTTGTSGSSGSTGSTGCTNPCTLNAVQCKDSGHVETCESVSGCNQFVVTTNCGVNQTCQSGACVDTGCSGGCNTPPGSVCIDQNTQESFSGTGTCTNNQCSYTSTETACAYGCSNGVCLPQQTCTPGAKRCNGDQIETCNQSGTAWLYSQTCSGTCTNGLCDAPCTPNATRCNGSNVETCNSAGTAWGQTQQCADGCVAGQCEQPSLDVNGGTPVLMDGEYHYSGTVLVHNGGSIQLDPNGATHLLTIYADEIDIEASSSITGADTTGGCSSIYVGPDDVHRGIRLYANTVVVNGTLSFTGTNCAKDGIVVRADTINGSGTVTSSERDLLLYGTGGLATGLSAAGAQKSLMPPAQITSPTYPDITASYNDDGPPPSFSWDRPYSTCTGYYYHVAVGTEGTVPVSSGADPFQTNEALTLASPPQSGSVGNAQTTYLDVISVDNLGNPGTVPHEFPITVVNTPPNLSSSTNPTQGTYVSNSAVRLQWSGGNAVKKYYYVIDNYPNTRPVPNANGVVAIDTSTTTYFNATFPTGRWWFHILGSDSMGYLTKGASHYEIDVGTQPSDGALAGTVTYADGGPLAGVNIVVQRGLYNATTDQNGVYNFATIPAGAYEVVAEKSGFEADSKSLTVNAGATTNGYFTLTGGNGCPNCADLCAGVSCTQSTATTCSGSTLITSPLWNATCRAGACVDEYSPGNEGSQTCTYGCNSGAGRCYNSGENGSSCTANSQCTSGYCGQGGYCQASYCYSGQYSYCSTTYGCCYPYRCLYDYYSGDICQ